MLLLKFATYIQGGPSCDMGKINASDKIMFENQKKKKYRNKEFVYTRNS